MQQTRRELVEAAGRLVANRSVPGSGVTVPCGTVDDTGRVELSSEAMKKTNTSKAPDRKIREMPMKKVSRVFDIQKITSSRTTSQEFQTRTCEHVLTDRRGVQQ